MNIDPLSNASFVPLSRPEPSRASDADAGASGGAAGDQLAAELSAGIRETLAGLPEVRPGVVARGRELLADPDYPTPDIVEKIASLITPLPEA